MSSYRTPDHDQSQFFVVSVYQSIPSGKPASYSHSEFGYFSIDRDRFFLPDRSQLGILNLPRSEECKNLDINLNAGFEGWQDLPNVQQHLDSMLYWILHNKELVTDARNNGPRNNSSEFGLNVDFVTSRGNLARMLNVLSGKDGKGWNMVAMSYRGTVYLSHIENYENDKELSAFGRRVCYWGKRFETEVTKMASSESSERETIKHGPIKAYPGFFSVMRFQLENHTIALRAEVDAEIQSVGEEPTAFVELKVTTETIVRAPWAFNRKRLVPWWCQSIVSGTPLIVYGIRDYDGHVKSIEGITTDDIPNRVGRENLDKDKYLLFLSDMLSWIKNVVSADDDGVVHMFQWDPNAHGTSVTAHVLPRDTDDAFLRDWYIREMEDYFLHMRKHASTIHVPTDQRHPRLSTAVHETLGRLEFGRTGNWEGMTREVKEMQREDEEIKIERMNRRFKKSWPTPEEQSIEPRFRQNIPEKDLSGCATSARAGERYMRDREKPRSEERDATYQQSGASVFYDDEHERTTLDVDDPRSRERKYSRLREETWRTSLLVGERSDHDIQSSRSRRPSSPYALRRQRAADNEARRYGSRSRSRSPKGHDYLPTGTRSGRKYENSRSSRFSNRDCSPPFDRQIPGSKVKRVSCDADYNARRTRQQGSTRREYPH